MRLTTISWALATWSYTENKVMDWTREHLGLKSHWKHDKLGSHFYGICSTDESGSAITCSNILALP